MSDHNRLVEQIGVGYFEYLAGRLGYLFREVKEHDKGIDAEIEITQAVEVQSPIIGVQIKSRTEFKMTKANEISMIVTEQNLEYWRSYGRPVILVAICNKQTDIFWTRVDNSDSRTIRISLEKKFNEHTLPRFTRIISQYYTDIVFNFKIKNVSEVLEEIGSTTIEILQPIKEKLTVASKLMNEKKFNKSAQIYESLTIIYDDIFSIRHNLVICLIMSRKINKAVNVAENFLKMAPEKWESHFLFSHCLGVQGQFEKAHQHALKALQIEPLSSIAWTNLGLLNHWQGLEKEAYEDLKVASLYAPTNEFIQFKLATCATFLKDYEGAIFHYDECIKLNEHFHEAYTNRGIILEHVWRIWDALDSYDKAININPQNFYALYKSAHLLKDLGYNCKSVQRYHSLLEDLDFKSVHMELGMLYCRTGDFTTAAYHFDKGYTSDSSNEFQNRATDSVVVILDMGYEVFYRIRVEFTQDSAHVLSVESEPKLAMFNSMKVMRDYIKYAHMVNDNLLSEDPPEDAMFLSKDVYDLLSSNSDKD
ncbi:MAG: DUF4365 domain-containing protein [Aphanocapsa sp. GSE-SYN-MK-11-07L]|jgi:tetratricopeptide (TPR) repeat protein|nr:DUF4365 domain-containing protein [Aphanocapsa sp. GSE-SYN-MK-11-07L]